MFPEVEYARQYSTESVLLTLFSELFHNITLKYGHVTFDIYANKRLHRSML